MGLWDKRPGDNFGLAASFSQLSPGLGEVDSETAFFTKTALPLRDYELVVELTYQAQVVAGWIIQPDFQYIIIPAAALSIPLILLSAGFLTPLFLLCALRSVFKKYD
jgi:porin